MQITMLIVKRTQSPAHVSASIFKSIYYNPAAEATGALSQVVFVAYQCQLTLSKSE
jgi:hypothetical protein